MKSDSVLRIFSCFESPSRILHFAIRGGWGGGGPIHDFCFFWFLSWRVGQNAAQWNWNQNCYLIMVTRLAIYVCLHFLHPHRKKYKGVVDYSTDKPFTHLALSINLISTFCNEEFQLCVLFGINWRVLSQWACWNYCMYVISISIIRNL